MPKSYTAEVNAWKRTNDEIVWKRNTDSELNWKRPNEYHYLFQVPDSYEYMASKTTFKHHNLDKVFRV